MGGDGRLRTPAPPRALLLATGEEVPYGQSVRARQLIVEAGPGDVERASLSECHAVALRGSVPGANPSAAVS
jgi:hypothetical protein